MQRKRPKSHRMERQQSTRLGLLATLFVIGWWALGLSRLVAQTPDQESQLAALEGRERVAQIVATLEAADYKDPEQAIALAEEALATLVVSPVDAQGMTDPVGGLAVDETERATLRLGATCGLCRAHLEAGNPEQARSVGAQCVDQAETLDATSWQGWAHLWCLGKGLAREGQTGLGVVHQLRAVELYESLGEPALLAEALTQTGMDLEDLLDLTTALEVQLRAHALYQSLGDLQGEAKTLLRVGTVYAAMEDWGLALEYAQKALAAFRTTGSLHGQAAALHNMGVAHGGQENPERALDLLRRSLEIMEGLDSPYGVAIRQLNIGIILTEQGRADQAFDPLQTALDLLDDLGAQPEQAIAGIALARAHKSQGAIDQGLDAIHRSIALAEELAIEERIAEAYEVLAELEEARGNLGEALAALRRHDALESRVINTTNARQLHEMEVRYRAQSQAQEIEELRRLQALQALEVEHQRTTRTAMLIGFGLLLLVLALFFNRYRLRTQAARMVQTLEHEKAVSARLREIDRLKDDFLANTSHELRTPLFGIVGLAESLLEGVAGGLPAAAQRNLQLILKNGRRLNALVGDILDSAKLRRQGLELDRQPVDLYSLVDIVLTLSRPLLQDQSVELVNAVPQDLPPALADANRVQQVLHNLVGNAIKFTHDGTVTVDAAIGDSSAGEAGVEANVLVLRVRDTGIGIAPELHDRIFDSFEQADASVERIYGGTGLGLTISRQLIRLHGGDLQVDSAPGQGATFSFTLPMATEEAQTEVGTEPGPLVVSDTSTGTSPQSEVTSTADGTTPLVLVIDDEPINRQVLHNHLTLDGHRVLSASGGAEALDLLAEQPIDLVLLDIMMPRMSGYEVCRRIRQRHSREEMPVIFLSAKNQASDRIAGFEEGGNDYLAKPIAKQELLKRVETQLELLQTHRSQAEELKILRGLLTICSSCKRIRDDDGEWDPIESYVHEHSEASFTHGLCPTCFEQLSQELASSRSS